MKKLEVLFDAIGKAITSLGAVIFVMLMTITGMIFFSHTLFTGVFPATMAPWEKIVSAWFMALGWEFTVLLTTCNTRHINSRIPIVMAVCSGLILLFFIQAFDNSQTWLTICQRWFVGVLVAAINYIYAELFYAKWQERNNEQQWPIRVSELQSTIVELQRNLNESQSALIESRSTMDENARALKELQKYKAKIVQDLTCPHCNAVYDGFGTLHAHKGHCSENPKNKPHENKNTCKQAG